jgi:hypothetical protein
MIKVIADGRRLIAIGTTLWPLGTGDKLVPAIWTSQDGRTWAVTKLPGPLNMAGTEDDVAAWDGRVVVLRSLGNNLVQAWASTDMSHWHVSTLARGTGSQLVWDGGVIVSHGTFLAWGGRQIGTASQYWAWLSHDAFHWKRYLTPTEFSAVVPHGKGFVGTTYDEVWESADGWTWNMLAGKDVFKVAINVGSSVQMDPARLYGIISLGPRLVVVGAAADGYGCPTAWVWSSDRMAADGSWRVVGNHRVLTKRKTAS